MGNSDDDDDDDDDEDDGTILDKTVISYRRPNEGRYFQLF